MPLLTKKSSSKVKVVLILKLVLITCTAASILLLLILLTPRLFKDKVKDQTELSQSRQPDDNEESDSPSVEPFPNGKMELKNPKKQSKIPSSVSLPSIKSSQNSDSSSPQKIKRSVSVPNSDTNKDINVDPNNTPNTNNRANLLTNIIDSIIEEEVEEFKCVSSIPKPTGESKMEKDIVDAGPSPSTANDDSPYTTFTNACPTNMDESDKLCKQLLRIAAEAKRVDNELQKGLEDYKPDWFSEEDFNEFVERSRKVGVRDEKLGSSSCSTDDSTCQGQKVDMRDKGTKGRRSKKSRTSSFLKDMLAKIKAKNKDNTIEEEKMEEGNP